MKHPNPPDPDVRHRTPDPRPERDIKPKSAPSGTIQEPDKRLTPKFTDWASI